MKADSLPTTRNRQAFYTHRKPRVSPSPSVCSSASSSINSASAQSTSMSASSSSCSRSSSRTALAAAAARRTKFNSPSTKAYNAVAAQLNPHARAGGNGKQRAFVPERRDSLPLLTTTGMVMMATTSAPSPIVGPSKEFETLLEKEYQEDVLVYMSEMETLTNASVELIDQQPELQWYMRPYLIDFLVEIHSQYRLRPETLYLAVNIADRYTSKRIVYKRHYQLVGCAALWIAAKFEDAKDRVPTVQDLCSMTCNAYDASAFIQMEGHVLSTLNWLIGHPTAESWLRAQSIVDPSLVQPDSRLGSVCRFLMENTLFHRAFVPLKSSEIVKGCLLLARFMLGKQRRTHDESTIAVQIAQMLDGHFAEHLEQVSPIVVKKYALPCFAHASTFVREWYLAGRRFDLESWPVLLPAPAAASTSSLSPSSYPLRRDSSTSSLFSSCAGSSSSPCSYGASCSSSDDDDMPLTPSTPLTQYGSEDGPASASVNAAASGAGSSGAAHKPSPLARIAMQRSYTAPIPRMPLPLPQPQAYPEVPGHAYQSQGQRKEVTPPSAPPLQVNLVPTSGPAMTLC